MFIAAFPKSKYAFYLPLFLYCLFCTPNTNDSSGTQLQMTYQYIFYKLYGYTDLFKIWLHKFVSKGSSITEIFQTYYDINHPFTKVVKENGISLTK